MQYILLGGKCNYTTECICVSEWILPYNRWLKAHGSASLEIRFEGEKSAKKFAKLHFCHKPAVYPQILNSIPRGCSKLTDPPSYEIHKVAKKADSYTKICQVARENSQNCIKSAKKQKICNVKHLSNLWKDPSSLDYSKLTWKKVLGANVKLDNNPQWLNAKECKVATNA